MCAGNIAFAQDYFGALHSNYSPTNSVHINPSSMLDAKTWLDIHIIGVGQYANNDFVAAKNTTLLKLRKKQDFTNNDLYFKENKNNYHVYSRTFVQLFGAVYSQGDHAVGLSFNGYNYFDVRRVNSSVAEILQNSIMEINDFDSTYTLDRLKVNVLSYGEAKISYAYTFQKRNKEMLMIGISLKKIFPIVGGAIKVDELGGGIYQDSVLVLDDFTGDLMVSDQPEFSFKGGMGLDIGFTYQRMYSNCSSYYPNSKRNGCSRKHYKYKIGISINDLGYAKFNPNNIQYYGYKGEGLEITLDDDPTSLPDALGNLDIEEKGNINKPYKMSLPTTFSVQLDYNILPNYLYVNATWIHGIGQLKSVFGPRRAHSLSVTPRFETKWFDLAIPFSLYEYQKPQIGMSVRLYFLTIGTDKLLQVFVPSNIYGADVYAMLKIPIFYNPKCKTKNKSSRLSIRKGKARKYQPCDAYR